MRKQIAIGGALVTMVGGVQTLNPILVPYWAGIPIIFFGIATVLWEFGSTRKIAVRNCFDIDMDITIATFGDYERICAIAVTNVGSKDLIEKCLVKIMQTDPPLPDGMPLPFPLRTEMQIHGSRSGRFTLATSERKTIPIVLRNPKRKNEWHIFDENGKDHFVPSGPIKLTVGIYGGETNKMILIKIAVLDDWQIDASISEVPIDYRLESAEEFFSNRH